MKMSRCIFDHGPPTVEIDDIPLLVVFSTTRKHQAPNSVMGYTPSRRLLPGSLVPPSVPPAEEENTQQPCLLVTYQISRSAAARRCLTGTPPCASPP